MMFRKIHEQPRTFRGQIVLSAHIGLKPTVFQELNNNLTEIPYVEIWNLYHGPSGCGKSHTIDQLPLQFSNTLSLNFYEKFSFKSLANLNWQEQISITELKTSELLTKVSLPFVQLCTFSERLMMTQVLETLCFSHILDSPALDSPLFFPPSHIIAELDTNNDTKTNIQTFKSLIQTFPCLNLFHQHKIHPQSYPKSETKYILPCVMNYHGEKLSWIEINRINEFVKYRRTVLQEFCDWHGSNLEIRLKFEVTCFFLGHLFPIDTFSWAKVLKIEPSIAHPNTSDFLEISKSSPIPSRFFGIITQSQPAVFLIDVSGSMAGGRLNAVKQDLTQLLDTQLKHQQKIAIGVFNNNCFWYQQQLISVKRNDLTAMKQWINNLNASGGTNMSDALAKAFSLFPKSHIYLLTDGEPNSSRKVNEVCNSRPADTIISTTGFKLGPSTLNFLKTLAQNSGGKFRKVD